jgi:hypothetical protein
MITNTIVFGLASLKKRIEAIDTIARAENVNVDARSRLHRLGGASFFVNVKRRPVSFANIPLIVL